MFVLSLLFSLPFVFCFHILGDTPPLFYKYSTDFLKIVSVTIALTFKSSFLLSHCSLNIYIYNILFLFLECKSSLISPQILQGMFKTVFLLLPGLLSFSLNCIPWEFGHCFHACPGKDLLAPEWRCVEQSWCWADIWSPGERGEPSQITYSHPLAQRGLLKSWRLVQKNKLREALPSKDQEPGFLLGKVCLIRDHQDRDAQLSRSPPHSKERTQPEASRGFWLLLE